MAHKGNIEFYLYTGFNQDATEAYAALEYLRTTALQYRHLHYGDDAAHADVFTSVGSWFETVPAMKFPFVVYTEQYEFTDPQNRVSKIVIGLDNIKATDWNALQAFSG